MKRLYITGFFLFIIAVFTPNVPVGAESGSQSTLHAVVTFQDGAVIQVSGPLLVYSWLRRSDTRYINPPINEDKSMGLWTEETNHGVTVRREVPLADIEQIEIRFERPGDTCSLTATVRTRDGQKFTKSTINAVPQDVAKRTPDAIFQSLELAGVVVNGSDRNKFSIKLWGSGVCPETKDVVKKVIFSIK